MQPHLLPPSTSLPSSLSSSATDASGNIWHIVFLGTHLKQPLFHKMCSVAQKVEPHIQYSDVCYLTFKFEPSGDQFVVELSDPGMEKTGERQMAIQQKADAILLAYAMYDPNSFHTLESLVDDFQMLDDPPATLLLCNTDQFLGENDGAEGGESSGGAGDDGYGSGEGSPGDGEPPNPNSRRRRSMEQSRRNMDEQRCPVAEQEGHQLAHLLGPQCEFRSLSFRALSDQFVADLIRNLIHRAIESNRRSRRRTRSDRNNTRPRLSPSPLKQILKKSPIKRLLHRAKSEVEGKEGPQKEEDEEGGTRKEAEEGEEEGGTRKEAERRRGTGKTALVKKALAHPRDRARVAASSGVEKDKEQPPAGLESSSSSIQHMTTPLSDSVRVNNFVEGTVAQKTPETTAERQRIAKTEAGRMGMTRKSSACMIQ